MKRSIALLLLILFELIVLYIGRIVGESMVIAIAFAGMAVLVIVVVGSSDFVQDLWDSARERHNERLEDD